MSSDDYFGDELDSAFFNEVDAIEAAHAPPPSPAKSRAPVAPARPPAKPVAKPPPVPLKVIEIIDSDDEYNISGINDDALEVFDQVCAAQSTSGPSTSAKPISRKASMGTVQTNLFGQIVSNDASSSKAGPSRKPMSRSNSSAQTPFAGRPKKTKQWDHSAFAKYGWKKPKGKEKAYGDEDEEEQEEEDAVEFEQFPAPSAPVGPVSLIAYTPPPMKQQVDLLSAKRWLYPLNKPKRDYQFNIVKKCLFDNTLVAIPTGLGKTFIAGVVMLNYYTWFPEGKVVFVAPTRPLVAQQIEACHQTCGIPGTHAVELTGQNPRAMRAKAWEEKRVFYMTPQTLMNDIRNGVCDCRDIVLLVIDEAHKGTGDYAYAQVVRYLMAKNPTFRLLALTATPGSTPEAVQTVVDSLHISHVEIRDEESLDLRQYMHEKRVEQHVIHMNDDIMRIADLLASLMQPLIKQLQGASIIRGYVDAKTLHPYRCQAAMKEVSMRRDKPAWAFKPLSSLGAMARAMGYLYEGSMGMCYNYLKTTFDDEKNVQKKPTKLQQDPKFQELIRELDSQRARGFIMHPKKEKMLDLIIQHFGSKMPDENGEEVSGSEGSRVMVFSTFRENVDELVEMLNEHQPLIRAVRFIGQGTDKQGRKGYAQKEQMEVIKKFKAGEYNVLVSTSVGEEGLDIGEVDMIICYESQKTPIRMLQRIGRTGRKKDGVVHVLLAEGREDKNWDKAKENYQQVQHFIVRAEHLELYDDVTRMLPEHIKPECVEMVMDIEEYNREEATKKAAARSPAKGSKRKRNDDMMRNIPAGAATSFVSVKDLLVKGATKKKKKELKPVTLEDLEDEDDSDDREIMGGLYGPRRSTSLSTLPKTSKTKKPRRAATTAGAGEKKKARKSSTKSQATPPRMTASQLAALEENDSDDRELEDGLFGTKPYVPLKHTTDSNPRTPPSSPFRSRARRSPSHRGSSPEIPLHSVIDLTTPDVGVHRHNPTDSPPVLPEIDRSVTVSDGSNTRPPTTSPSVHSARSRDRTSAIRSSDPDLSLAWLIADDSDSEIQFMGSSPSSRARRLSDAKETKEQDADDSIMILEDYVPPPPSRRQVARSQASSSKRPNLSQEDMPPPALPPRFNMPSPEMPPPTFAPRGPGKKSKKRVLLESVESSPTGSEEPAQKRSRLQRRKDVSLSPTTPAPQPKAKKKTKLTFKDASEVQRYNPWVELEAEHSGGERSVGSSGPEDMDEYEPSFVQDYPETQASPSYDQTAIYRQSLLSQAPGRPLGPLFANKPVKRGQPPSRMPSGSKHNGRYVVSSSPTRVTDEEPDEYVFGSFVVDDDEDISYAAHSSD
ncbi:3'-5' DNA helicase [Steccherinum ochraceum]|uniref:ATP-dependent DNA helicase n=1 Tax=Steccherinum ochraceum TaxID=92696 RepID=A0A4R0RKV2_9APHY|nr:3'-5' DNA helicase [Steccherinum ochraceum]